MSDQLLGNLVWKITGDSTNFDKAVAGTEKKAEGFGGKLKGIGIAAAAAFSVGAIVNFGKKLIGITSDAEETANKFGVVFSTIKGEADAAAYNLEKNYGLSGKAAQQLLSDTGDLLTGFGFTQESALNLSEQVNTLAVDLASFTNYSGGAEGASAALTKGLLGEREALKSLGIAITDADIKQLAEDNGIVGELDRQTKASLTLELALKQSKNAIGDFARSQDSFANQSRIAESALADLGTTIGKKILPFATAGVSSFGKLVKSIDDAISGKVNLSGATNDLIDSSKTYSSIIEELKTKGDALNETEKQTLNARADIAKQSMIENLVKLSEEYGKATKKIDEQNASVEYQTQAYTAATEERKKLAEMSEEEKKANFFDETEYLARIALIDQAIVDYQRQLGETRIKQTEMNEEQQQALYSIARAYNAGTVSIAEYKSLNVEFYNAIIKASGEVKKLDADQEKAAKEAKKRADEQEARDKKEADRKAKLSKLVDDRTAALEDYNRAVSQSNTKMKDGFISEEEHRENLLSAARAQADALYALGYSASDASTIGGKELAKMLKIIKELTPVAEKASEAVEEVAPIDYYAKAIDSVKALSDATLSASGKARKEAIDAISDLQKQDGEKQALTDEELSRYDELKKKVGEYYDALDDKEKWNNFISLAGTATSAVSGLFDALASAITASTDAKLEALDAEKEAALEAAGVAEDTAVETAQAELNAAVEAGDEEAIASAEVALKKARIEEEYAKKREQLAYEGALSAWKLNLLSTTAQSAMGVLNAFNSGIQAGPYAGPVLAGILTALAAATGSASIAAVTSAKPVLATGAVIPSRPGGVEAIIGEDTTSSGEVVLGLGQQGSPLIEELASRLASKVSSGGGVTNLYLDGKLVAQASANYFNSGQVKLK